ncbi:hypothetical protein BJF78_20475 [Pseudonocardia sp. CNS-139]|nr:hypothetical protein BJF78_20475 [Pseudonocardia sp. CNS-139]
MRRRGAGWEIPAAVGVASAAPGRQVVAVVGDGRIAHRAAELAAAARQEIAFVLVGLQHPDRGDGTDHLGLMAAVGCAARRVEQPAAIAGALRWAAVESESTRRPVLVEVAVADVAAPHLVMADAC